MKFVIPNIIRITTKLAYEVLYIDDFKDGSTDGECRYNESQIVIKRNLPITKRAKTFIHEVIHAIDDKYKVGLSEAQVLKLEEGIYRVLRLNKWLK